MRQLALLLAVAGLAWLGPARASGDVRPTWNTREAVELRLAGSRALTGARIRVDAGADGAVKLTGEVLDEAQRERAVRIASGTPGVRVVEQSLAAGAAPPPAPRPDPVLAQEVAQRLAARSPARATAEQTWTSGWRVRGDGWALAVEVDDGDVMLEGEVSLQEHLHEFVIAARSVPGVRSVRADASVRSSPPPEDPYHP